MQKWALPKAWFIYSHNIGPLATILGRYHCYSGLHALRATPCGQTHFTVRMLTINNSLPYMSFPHFSLTFPGFYWLSLKMEISPSFVATMYKLYAAVSLQQQYTVGWQADICVSINCFKMNGNLYILKVQ